MSKSASQAAATLGKLGGKIGGLSKSPKKLAACRENAKKAGRKPMTRAQKIASIILRGSFVKLDRAEALSFANKIIGTENREIKIEEPAFYSIRERKALVAQIASACEHAFRRGMQHGVNFKMTDKQAYEFRYKNPNDDKRSHLLSESPSAMGALGSTAIERLKMECNPDSYPELCKLIDSAK